METRLIGAGIRTSLGEGLDTHAAALQSADQRAAALAAFDMVDAVTIFEDDTPQNLIAQLKPDLIVKGGDYEADDVVGNDIVKKWGGKVVIVPTLANYSTSKFVKTL